MIMTLLPLQGVCMEKHQAVFSQPNVTIRIIKFNYWASNNSDRVSPGVVPCVCICKSGRLTAFNGSSTGGAFDQSPHKGTDRQSHHIEHKWPFHNHTRLS